MSDFTAVSALFAGTDIFVIPTFQRPYSWEEAQWDDLLRDIRFAAARKRANRNTIHYFGAIHTIKVESDDPLLEFYTDQDNKDIKTLRDSDFLLNGKSYNVHLVVDGQQRLISLYALLERCQHLNDRFLDGDPIIPKLILNPRTDHIHWRYLLKLDATKPQIETTSQKRLHAMFETYKRQADFSTGTPEHNFLIQKNAKTMWIELPSGMTLSPFLTLNDRGKDLTKLEKVKSLTMEADENHNNSSAAHTINTAFGGVYRSIDLNHSLLKDDDFIRQLAIALWESKSGQLIGGIPELTHSRIHDESLENIYEKFRTHLSNKFGDAQSLISQVASQSISSQSISSQSIRIADENNALSQNIGQACVGNPISAPSFVNAIFPSSPHRDAREDYNMVLVSLGLQPKQIAFLLSVRSHYQVDWHQPIGRIRLSNTTIKKNLLDAFQRLSTDISVDPTWKGAINNEIESIPDQSDRDVTPLYLAELLRLIVGNAKPGNFTYQWQISFGAHKISGQSLVDAWTYYLVNYDSRDNFIIGMATSQYWDNRSPELSYLLREFEACLPNGVNAHCEDSLEIEHFFGRDYEAIKSSATQLFTDSDVYRNKFVDRLGNKLLISKPLNQELNKTPVTEKASVYRSGRGLTQSAMQVGNDLSGVNNIDVLYQYVLLRQLRLAAFAAKRF